VTGAGLSFLESLMLADAQPDVLDIRFPPRVVPTRAPPPSPLTPQIPRANAGERRSRPPGDRGTGDRGDRGHRPKAEHRARAAAQTEPPPGRAATGPSRHRAEPPPGRAAAGDRARAATRFPTPPPIDRPETHGGALAPGEKISTFFQPGAGLSCAGGPRQPKWRRAMGCLGPPPKIAGRSERYWRAPQRHCEASQRR
jgi:hypothetical protein